LLAVHTGAGWGNLRYIQVLGGETCGTYRCWVGKLAVHTGAGWGNLQGNRQLGRENNIQMKLQRTKCEGVEWIHLAYDRDKWRALVKMVIKMQGIS